MPKRTDFVGETVNPSPTIGGDHSFSMPYMQLYETKAHQKRGSNNSNDDPGGQRSRLVLEVLVEHRDEYRLHPSKPEKNTHVVIIRDSCLERRQVEFDVRPTD